MAGLPAFVFAPSDLTAPRARAVRGATAARLPARGKRVLVGGRVALVNPGRLLLTDACARLDALGEALDASIGDLVVVRGVYRAGKLHDAEQTALVAAALHATVRENVGRDTSRLIASPGAAPLRKSS